MARSSWSVSFTPANTSAALSRTRPKWVQADRIRRAATIGHRATAMPQRGLRGFTKSRTERFGPLVRRVICINPAPDSIYPFNCPTLEVSEIHDARRAVLFGLSAIVLAAPAIGVEQGNPINGRKMAESLCSRCHAISGPGLSPVPAAPVFRTLHKTQPPEDLSAIFKGNRLARHSNVEMPQFTFAPDQIDDLLAYIRSVRRGPHRRHGRRGRGDDLRGWLVYTAIAAVAIAPANRLTMTQKLESPGRCP